MSTLIKSLIDFMPEDIVSYIFPFISVKTLVFINTKYYSENHKLVKNMIPQERYEAYIRNTIRRDNYYTLSFLLNENVDKWINMNRYLYKHQIFTNYLYFINYLSIENKSNKSRVLIENKAQEILGKKWHKKIKIRNCKWSI